MNYLIPFDVAALLVLWWTAAVFAHGTTEARTWRSLLLSGSLILVHAFSITGVFSLIGQGNSLDWISRGVIWGCAGVAAWLYDHRFGVLRHLRMTREAASSWLSRHKSTTGARR